MITTCTECQARYQLDAERIPPRMIKVRCPSCGGVFSLDGSKAKSQEEDHVEEPLGLSTGFGDFNTTPPEADQPAASIEKRVPERAPTPDPAPVAESEPVAADETVVSAGATVEPAMSVPDTATEVAVMDPPAQKSPRRRRNKEEMLARALVSDIMVYNRDLYDQAKADNNLLEALGSEIKKSWELYKEKVTPEVANSTNHFRDALNEILAEGENIF